MGKKADQLKTKNCISYVSVSTRQHGNPELGIKEQQEAIRRFCKAKRFNIVEEFVDQGQTLALRPKLKAALAAARKIRDPDYTCAPIIVARLDRLSRNVRFISGLILHKVPFVTIELGLNVEPMMLHVYAAFAEYERRKISEPTKANPAGAHTRGKKLGGNNAQSLKSKAEAMEFAETLRPVIMRIKAESREEISASAICRALNARKIKTSTGGRWYPQTAIRLLNRLGESVPLTPQSG